ncbi:MAG: transcription antitermination factor NusB [Acutalibacteraceae bacterium]
MKNARTAAHAALLQVDVNAGYSNIVIDKAIKEANLDQRDASLAAAIFYGVLERRITLTISSISFPEYPQNRCRLIF